MFDRELIAKIIENILIAISRIERRFEGIEMSEDFLKDDSGIDRLDGITMMLIAVGEQLKQLDKVLNNKKGTAVSKKALWQDTKTVFTAKRCTKK